MNLGGSFLYEKKGLNLVERKDLIHNFLSRVPNFLKKEENVKIC